MILYEEVEKEDEDEERLRDQSTLHYDVEIFFFSTMGLEFSDPQADLFPTLVKLKGSTLGGGHLFVTARVCACLCVSVCVAPPG